MEILLYFVVLKTHILELFQKLQQALLLLYNRKLQPFQQIDLRRLDVSHLSVISFDDSVPLATDGWIYSSPICAGHRKGCKATIINPGWKVAGWSWSGKPW